MSTVETMLLMIRPEDRGAFISDIQESVDSDETMTSKEKEDYMENLRILAEKPVPARSRC